MPIWRSRAAAIGFARFTCLAAVARTAGSQSQRQSIASLWGNCGSVAAMALTTYPRPNEYGMSSNARASSGYGPYAGCRPKASAREQTTYWSPLSP